MDPCPFVRIAIGNLALNFSQKSRLYSLSFYSKSKLEGFPSQISDIPFLASDADADADTRIHACFTLSKPELEKLSAKFCRLKIEIYSYRRSNSNCHGFFKNKLLGCVLVQLDLNSIRGSCPVQNGWVPINGGGSDVKLHLNVRAEPDPRFVFQFDGDPECSPQVFQINGNVKQPVFTCNFTFRNCIKSRSCSASTSSSACCLGRLVSDDEDAEIIEEERKGWSITIHDLSGSPVAAASMVTPFVPESPGADSVGKSNPGAWLILRPAGYSSWKPWGRLEAWRERNTVCYRFELIPHGALEPIPLAYSYVSTKTGGKFTIDITTAPTPMATPSPSTSFDFSSFSDLGSGSGSGSGSWAHLLYRGFVMSSTVGANKPEVEVGVQHVTCTEDAAAFVALAAAMDLSMDACRLFSQKLRKELRHPILE